ncbi:MAG: hypothetical protein NC347_00335 [Clostridium sp.]|nr:hypothetical protein [Clostridium sp.]
MYYSEYEKLAEDFCERRETTVDIQFDCRVPQPWGNKPYCVNRYKVKIKRHNKTMTILFYNSVFNTERGESPTTYNILSCLQKSDPGTFRDFCLEFGYDYDSRKAEQTYHAVRKEWLNVKALFGDVLEELEEIA